MKIGFVNQPIDTVLPPYQNSVGACTYGAACSLSKSSEVIVYGTSHHHKDLPTEFQEQNVHFRFFPLPFLDRLAGKAGRIYSQLVPLSPPASSSKLFYRTFGRRVAEDLRAQACDVIHVQHCSQYLPVIRASNPNAKIVLQLHAEWFSQNRVTMLKQRLRYVDLVTTVSDYITEKTRRQFPMMAARCQTMYNAVDAAEFSRDRSYGSPQRREKRILYAGAVSPHKGVHVLLDAFAIVVKQYPEVQLDIVGSQRSYPLTETFEVQERELIESVYPFYSYDWVSRLKANLGLARPDAGTYIGNLKERLPPEARGKVTFLGFVRRPDLLDLYYQADVFAFAPIWNEGFGIPPVEAMAAGTPVVASRSGAIPEIVKDKKTGFLVNKNDPDALAERILTLLRDDNLREDMGRAGRSWVRENFIWEKSARSMYRYYVDLCGD